MYDVVVKKFTFAVSSRDELLVNTVVSVSLGPPTRCIIIYNNHGYSHIAEVTAATDTLDKRRTALPNHRNIAGNSMVHE